MRCAVVLSILLVLPRVLFAEDYFQPIPMAEVARLKDGTGVVVLDVNVEEIWVEHSIPGAVHVDGSDIAKFLPPDKKALLIFYCAGPGSRRAADAANAAVMLGYRRVYVMTDGIFAWLGAGYAVE